MEELEFQYIETRVKLIEWPLSVYFLKLHYTLIFEPRSN